MKKRFKKILVFLLCFAIIVSNFVFGVSADSSLVFTPFTDLVIIDAINSSDIDYYKIGSIDSNGVLSYQDPLLENDDVSGSLSSMIVGECYLMQYDSVGDFFTSNWILYSEYIGMYWQNGYWTGYFTGAESDVQSAFTDGKDYGYDQGYSVGKSNGYSDGYADGQSLYAYGTTGYNNIYESGRAVGFSEGRDYAVANGFVDDHGFYNMLRNIALFPVEIFTGRYNEITHEYEGGLNIDIFGVNVGGFLLGLGIIAIILFVIKKFRG